MFGIAGTCSRKNAGKILIKAKSKNQKGFFNVLEISTFGHTSIGNSEVTYYNW